MASIVKNKDTVNRPMAVVEVVDADGNESLALASVSINEAGEAVAAPPAAVTEDAAAAANPSGTHLMARRRDTLVTNEVSAENDVIALNATNKGELHTRNLALEALLPAALAANGGFKIEGVAGGVAVPVSSATLATAAKQPALGTAGTASADVISVQGIAAMTPLLVTPSAPIGGAYTDRSIVSLSGASEQLMAANSSRRILLIHNEGATSITVNLAGGTAVAGVGGNITLTAGQQIKLDNYPPTGAITIIGTATGDVTAYEG